MLSFWHNHNSFVNICCFMMINRSLKTCCIIITPFNNLKMVNLLVLVLLLCIARSETPLSSCFHNQKFKITNTTYFRNRTAGYAYNIPWTQTQSNITKSSYTLIGYLTDATLNQFAFNASLANLGPSGGTFIFDPQPLSAILSIHFSIILFSSCSGYVQLQLIQFVPAQLNLPVANRTLDSSSYNVTVSRPFASDVNNYKSYAFLSAFYLTQSTYMLMDLKAETSIITSGSSTHKVTITSPRGSKNRYDRIWFTYLLIYIPLFQEQISHYFTKYEFRNNYWSSNNAITPNLGIPNNFNPNFTEKCLISLSQVFAYRFYSVNQMGFNDIGNTGQALILSYTDQGILISTYQIFCLQQCSQGGSIDRNFSTYTCINCNITVPFCQKCYYDSVNASLNTLTVLIPNSTNTTTKTLYCKKCQTNYYLLSADNACYFTCPNRYYANNATDICSLCNSVCNTCVDNLNCITYIIGWPVDGGCTTIDGCTKAISPVICSKCSNQMNFVLNGGTCSCASSYYLVSHLCVNVFGCAGAKVISNQTICILCNSIYGFVMNNGTCSCKDGYIFGAIKCLEICGDGKLYEYECDDGNTINGDGCSSDCKVEENYQCLGGSKFNPSNCIYLKRDISLSVTDIQKEDLWNKGTFTIQVNPYTGNIAQLNFATAVKFQCNQSISINSISYSNSQLIISVQYFEDLEGFPATLTLNLDGKYFVQPTVFIAFDMISHGNKLTLSSNLVFVKKMLLILSILAILVFASSLFVHKMIGVELMLPFQVVYLVHLVNNQYTQEYGLLKYIAYTSWNFLGIDQGSTTIATSSSHEPFDISSQSFTLKMMLGLTFSLLATFLAVIAVKAAKNEHDPAKTLKFLQKLLLLLYNQILFPITVVFFLVFLTIVNTMRLQENTKIVYLQKNLQALFMVLASLIYFFQWKILLVSDAKNAFIGVEKCHNRHIAYFISVFYLITKTISFSCYHPQIDATIPSLGLLLVLLLWIIAYMPYQGRIHNNGVIINMLPSIAFLSWNLVRQKLGLFQNQQMEYLIVLVIVGLFFLSIIASVIRVIYQIWLIKKAKQAALTFKLQKQLTKQKKKQQIMQIIQRQRMDIDKDRCETPILQQLKRMKQEKKTSGYNLSLLGVFCSKIDGGSSSSYLRKIKNKLGEPEFQSNRNKLLHHL